MTDQAAQRDDAAQDPTSAAVAPAYAFEGAALELGGLMVGPTELVDVPVRIPLLVLNRQREKDPPPRLRH
jgi:uncharacterized protein